MAIGNERKFLRLPKTTRFQRARYYADKATTRAQAQSTRRGASPTRLSRITSQRRVYWDAMADRYDRQTALLNDYLFPPVLDYVTNEDQRPIYFDAFEFEHELTQKDLQNIWQNLPPLNNQKFEKQGSTIEIDEYFTNKLFGGVGAKHDLRWMVFKVKQRAAMDYDIFSKLGLTRDIPIVEPSINSDYSFNWPYDYFSLVELVKIDETVKYVSDDIELPDPDPPDEPVLGTATGVRGTEDPATRRAGEYSDSEARAVLNRAQMRRRRRS